MNKEEIKKRRDWIKSEQDAIMGSKTIQELNKFYAKYCKELCRLNIEISNDMLNKKECQSKVDYMRDIYFMVAGLINFEKEMFIKLN